MTADEDRTALRMGLWLLEIAAVAKARAAREGKDVRADAAHLSEVVESLRPAPAVTPRVGIELAEAASRLARAATVTGEPCAAALESAALNLRSAKDLT
jgi:hypothetical protein